MCCCLWGCERNLGKGCLGGGPTQTLGFLGSIGVTGRMVLRCPPVLSLWSSPPLGRSKSLVDRPRLRRSGSSRTWHDQNSSSVTSTMTHTQQPLTTSSKGWEHWSCKIKTCGDAEACLFCQFCVLFLGGIC